jgi:hypothetical protein
MKCPHCLVEFHDKKIIIPIGKDVEGDWAIETYECPNTSCKKAIFFLINAKIEQNRNIGIWQIAKNSNGQEEVANRELVRPKGSSRPPAPKEVPKNIANDYTEACIVLPYSAKASAALSRRCLQHLLRHSAAVIKSELVNEIQQVLDSNQLPTYLAESIDAIRNLGNFAAHPLKSISTGQIIEVEPGEAEWNLEVLELLFDFYYVQPEKTKQRRAALNSKLGDTGKPNMK